MRVLGHLSLKSCKPWGKHDLFDAHSLPHGLGRPAWTPAGAAGPGGGRAAGRGGGKKVGPPPHPSPSFFEVQFVS